MPVERFYYPSNLSQNDHIELIDQEFHHLAHVIRGEVGDVLEIVNGNGQLAKAVIERIDKRKAILNISSVFQAETSPSKMILAQALPRMNRLDYILEKGTELGMTEIWIFPTQLGEKKQLTIHQIGRLSSITIAAMKQSGRLFLPKIILKPKLDLWKDLPCSSFFGDVSPNAPLFKNKWKDDLIQKGVLFFIGPESGFSDSEEQELNRLGATGVKLHENILRTDTAGIMALSLVSHFSSTI